MPTIAVTGATGRLGRAVIANLRTLAPDAKVVAIARSAEKAAALKDQGTEVRIADYDQPETFPSALAGVDRLLLVSSSEVGKRVPQHQAVIAAAKEAGVSFLAYTSLLRASTSDSPLASEHLATERAIASSGIPHTLLRNGWYHENFLATLGQVRGSGVLLTSAGAGKVSSAARADFAEAAAVVLADHAEHVGKTFELGGDASWTQEELAADLSAVIGSDVQVKHVTAEEHAAALTAAGVPSDAIGFIVGIDRFVASGGLEERGGALSRLLGRPTSPLIEVLRAGG